jgi:hypothetical protein
MKEDKRERILKLRGEARRYLLSATALIGSSAGQASADSAVEVLEAAATNLREAINRTKEIIPLAE